MRINRLLVLWISSLVAGCASNGAWNWPSQKCDSSKPETTPISRFKIGTTDGAVSDSKTQLTWKLCAEGQNYDGSDHCSGDARKFKWNDAITTFGDKGSGWRMPNIDELASLVEKQCNKPSVNLAAFPDWPKQKDDISNFWSASAYAGGAGSAWLVNFGYGFDGTSGESDGNYSVFIQG